MKPNIIINYLSLLILIVIGYFVIQLGINLTKDVKQVETQVNCIATYFDMTHRTGDTTLSCKVN